MGDDFDGHALRGQTKEPLAHPAVIEMGNSHAQPTAVDQRVEEGVEWSPLTTREE
jgi:hypothetical protein